MGTRLPIGRVDLGGGDLRGVIAMNDQKVKVDRLQFGIFEVELKSGELRRSGVRVGLQRLPFKILVTLLERPGEVVTRQELQQALWGTETSVDFDHRLGNAVNKLREALGDQAEKPLFIETLTKRGFRFIAPVKLPQQPPGAESAESSWPVSRAMSVTRWQWIAAGTTLISLLLGIAFLLRPDHRTPYRIAQVTYTGHVFTNEVENGKFSSLASDGPRLYFSDMHDGSSFLAVALVANGETSYLNLPPEIRAPLIGSLAPDGSRLIVRSLLQQESEQPLWIVPTLGHNFRPVPNVLAHDATWMPDGQRLLVASGNELEVVGSNDSAPYKLATLPGQAFWLRWSPDGQRLRFTLRVPKTGTSELWEMTADGRNLHPLLPGWSRPASDCCGSWTSDGKYYVFQSSHNGRHNIWALPQRTWSAWRSVPQQITNGPLSYESPGTSPDSDHIYFVGVDTKFELLHALPGSYVFVPLGQNLSRASMAEYSHDGQWVAWLNTADNSLWCSRTDGTKRIQLNTGLLRVFSVKWSSDNRRLAVMAQEPGMPWKIYLVNAEGGPFTPAFNDDRNQADPSWSPDGQYIVFGRLPNSMDNSQPKALYLLNMQTHNVTVIPGSTGLFSPRLSPDGRYIAAVSLDQRTLMLFDRARQRWTTLATHAIADPTWSHDSSYVFFQDFLEAGRPIYRITAPTGQTQLVINFDSLRSLAASSYRLIGLAPGDLPMVSARVSTVNLYSVDLNE